jgi:putative FmdB family regulatory protein
LNSTVYYCFFLYKIKNNINISLFYRATFKMPIYEYQTESPDKACTKCIRPFEVLQNANDRTLRACPACGGKVKKIMSLCHGAIVETSEEHHRVEKKIRDYEKAGMWSHAAELADKVSEKTKDRGLRTRALDDYKKAGYNDSLLASHGEIKQD